MKKILSVSLWLLFLLFLSLALARPASAHGEDPRLEISAESLNPGAQLELRGVDFEIEKEIALSLVGSQVEIPLGMVTADVEGTFLFIVALPADLKEGVYVIRATAEDHAVDSPPFTVSGVPILENSGEGRLDEDAGYGLLAPMPTPARGVSTPAPQMSAPVESARRPRSSLPLVWIVSGIAGLAVLIVVFRSKR